MSISCILLALLLLLSPSVVGKKKKGDDGIRSQEKMLVEIATIPNRYVPGGHAQRELVHQKVLGQEPGTRKGPSVALGSDGICLPDGLQLFAN